MGDVIDIADAEKGFCIIGPLNEPHFVPTRLLLGMAKGKNKIINEGQEREDVDLMRGIIAEWLEFRGVDCER